MIGTSVMKELTVIHSLVNSYIPLMLICSLAALNESSETKETKIEKEIVEMLE